MVGRGRICVALAGLLLAQASCGKGASAVGKSIGKAAIMTAVAVAAAAARARPCALRCDPGMVCNAEQDACVTDVCASRDPQCGVTSAYLDATQVRPAAPASADEPLDESCAGMCLSTEKCVVYRGDLDCVAR